MKTSLAILAFTVALIYGCKKDDSATNVQNPAGNYFPFEVGRSWTYNTEGTKPDGQPDPLSMHTVVASVFQMNQSIAGQPNATIIQTTDERQRTDNFVLFAEPSKLWAYFSSTFSGIQYSYLSFNPLSQSPVFVGVSQTQIIKIYNNWPTSGSFDIRRQPNANYARATLVPPDTLRLEGVSLGVTSMAIGVVGSLDSMTVIVNVVNAAQGFGPAYTPWMPLWEASLSTSERDLYMWDSTFSFKRSNGVTLRDRVVYHVTGHFVQYETVSAAGGSINAEKHAVQMSMMETIDSVVGGTTYPVYNGLSYQMTGNLWVASGVGFVKGDISGMAISKSGQGFFTALSGYVDTQGVFHGMFISPRLVYYILDIGGHTYEALSMNGQGASQTGTNSFVLTAKNF